MRARLVNRAPDAYGRRRFPEDLNWQRDRDDACAAVAAADVVHFHHWFDFGSTKNPFGFDFLGAMKNGARHLIHWHSSPAFIARNSGVDERLLHEARMPQLVMAQYHERYYPRAVLVPLIVEHSVSAIPSAAERAEVPHVVFTPSQSLSRHAERWETKGKPEVERVLVELERRGVLRASIEQDLPFEECQRLRSTADIVIDDVVTGSFHTTSLEAMSMGKPTLCWLDARTRSVLSDLAGTTDLPLVDAPFIALQRVLESLCADRELLRAIGSYAHEWMRAHYREEEMVAHYVRAYERLLDSGELEPREEGRHRIARAWLHSDLPDRIWASERNRFHPHVIRRFLAQSVRDLRVAFDKNGRRS